MMLSCGLIVGGTPLQWAGGEVKKCTMPLIPLISAATEGKYIVSLDYSLAFDYCDPQLAMHIFRKTGMPRNLCNVISTVDPPKPYHDV